MSTILRDYILQDPVLNAIPNTPDGCAEIAEILNTPSVPGYKPITIGTAMLWAAEGPRIRIAEAIANTQQPEAVRASCQVFLDLLIGGASSLLHTEETGIKNLFNAWVLTGVITQAEHDRVYLQPNGLACTLLPQSVILLGTETNWQQVLEARNM